VISHHAKGVGARAVAQQHAGDYRFTGAGGAGVGSSVHAGHGAAEVDGVVNDDLLAVVSRIDVDGGARGRGVDRGLNGGEAGGIVGDMRGETTAQLKAYDRPSGAAARTITRTSAAP